jgi:hypothetical protein
VEKQIKDLLRAKKGLLAIAKEVGVGSGMVQRIAREMAGGVGPFDGGKRRGVARLADGVAETKKANADTSKSDIATAWCGCAVSTVTVPMQLRTLAPQ